MAEQEQPFVHSETYMYSWYKVVYFISFDKIKEKIFAFLLKTVWLYVILIHHIYGLPMAAEVVSWAVVSWSSGRFCVSVVAARGCSVEWFVVELSCKEHYIRDNENDALISIFSVFSDRILIIWSLIRNGIFLEWALIIQLSYFVM